MTGSPGAIRGDDEITARFDLPWPAFWARLAVAQHMIGRYEEQLATARRGREIKDDLWLRLHEIEALYVLNRRDEARRLLDELERIEEPGSNPGSNPGWALSWIAADLARHGHAAEAQQVAQRALAWCRSRDSDAYAISEAIALLLVDRAEEAVELLRVAVAKSPENVIMRGLLGVVLARTGDHSGAEAEAQWLSELDQPYIRGRDTYWRVAIAAYLDQADAATRLLRQALQEGWSFQNLHFDPSFAPLWGYEQFERLIAPKG